MHTQKIDTCLSLKTNGETAVEPNENEKRSPPLAVIFSWLLAKKGHVNKYCNIYLEKGYDVLTVQVTPQQMLFPATGSQVVAATFLEYLLSHNEYDQILLHGFSVGAYLFGEVLIKMKTMERYSKLADRFVGLIFDSAVDFESAARGIARSVTKNTIGLRLIEFNIQLYLKLLYNVSTKHYIRSSQCFHNNFLSCPALFMGSRSDMIGQMDGLSNVARKWKENGIDVSIKCWEKSGHVSHMMYHPEEYNLEINNFLKKLEFHK